MCVCVSLIFCIIIKYIASDAFINSTFRHMFRRDILGVLLHYQVNRYTFYFDGATTRVALIAPSTNQRAVLTTCLRNSPPAAGLSDLSVTLLMSPCSRIAFPGENDLQPVFKPIREESNTKSFE